MKAKRLFFRNVVALFLCVAMLLGSTYAWFTDLAESKNNVIQTGKLDVEMYWSDTLLAADSSEWKNGENVPLFTSTTWEPGRTEVKYIKVKNAGNLSFKWKLAIEAVGEMTKLADVIDVYCVNPVDAGLTSASLTVGNHTGVLTDVVDMEQVANGVLLPAGETSTEHLVGDTILAIAFHMQESAGNEYIGLSLGDGFKVNVYATQFAYESGSFGDSYDEDAQWPNHNVPVGNAVSAPVNTTADDKVAENVTLTDSESKISASIPAGVQLEPDVDTVTLTVSEVENSKANISLNETEATLSIDVHVSGVAKTNSVIMPISIKALLPVGLNMGNYRFYHVEDGATVEMALLADGQTPVHNNYEYDPATGDVVLYLASFSEVALVANEENAWKGEFDYEWYDADATELTIANADQLAAFGAIVGGMAEGIEQDSFSGKTVKLIADINLGYGVNENAPIFYPIGYNSSDGMYEKTGVAVTTGFYNFCGTFDGNGHTVANFYHNTWEMKGDNNYYDATLQCYRDGMGLFGKVYGGTVKNLTVKNFSSDGEYTTTGVIAAYADGATFENIAIFNCNPRVYNIGNGGIVGCVGWYAKEANLKTTFKNITVDNSNKISALWGSYDVACGGIVGQYYPTSGQTSANKPANGGLSFENCHISAQMDVYNDVCANYQYYAYRYTGMLIGSVRENVTIDGHSYPKMDGITAKDCTVHFGTWNDYYYCEIIDNTTASYTHDYQMSRLTEIKAIDGTTITYLDGTTGTVPASGRANYVIVDYTKGHGTENATCYHFKDGAVWTHDMGGIQTGVDENGDGQDDLKEDKQHIYLEFNNLVTGYGWGVTTKGVGDLAGVTILDREVADSKVKFDKADTAKDSYMNGKPITIGDLFKAAKLDDEKLSILSASVSVTVSPVGDDSTAGGTYTANTTDWTQGTLTFTGTGAATITITDYYFCTPTTITVEITDRQPEEKFDVVMNNGDFLHRVGNSGTVALDKLFKAKDGVTVGTVSVAIEAVNGTSASGTYSNNAIQFNGTGIVKVAINDDDKYCTPTVLYLEVVDAVNATGATSATENNVVLLDNANASSLEISNGYSFYGNGFTLTFNGDGSYRSAAVSYGFVTVSNGGILDNVQIRCKIFPESYLYTTEMQAGSDGRYPYGYSAVITSGNATISNSYIYGARNNIQVGEGNVLIDNTVVECGSLSNIHIKSNSSYTVTLKDVTTIQYPTTDDFGKNKKVMGLGVLVGTNESESNPTIKLQGDFKQYNWVTASTANGLSNTYAQSAIKGALNITTYQHKQTDDTIMVNMGIAYMNTFDYTQVVDERVNKSSIPYHLQSIRIASNDGQVCSIAGSSITNATERYDANTDGILPYRPTVNRPIAPKVSHTDSANANISCETLFENGEWITKFSADLDKINGGSYSFKFSDLTVTKYGITLEFIVKDSDGNTINKDTAITLNQLMSNSYTLIVTDNQLYNASEELTEKTVTHEMAFVLSATKTSIEPPKFTNAGTATAIRLVSSKGGDWRPAYTVLTGVSVTYWSASESQVKTVVLSELYNSGTISSNVWTYTCEDYTLTITGGQVHSDGSKITPVVSNGTLYFASTNKAFTTSTTSRSIILTYVFTDKNDSTTWNFTETVSYSSLSEYDYDSFKNGTLKEPSSGGNCVTPDTLITLADGTQARVDSLVAGDMLLVWNLETGKLDTAPIMFNDSDAETEFEVIKLYFSDGTEVKVIGEHGFWDYDLNKYVYLDRYADQYIGHTFAKQNGDSLEKVQLVDVVIETEVTTAWSPVTVGHLCYFVNGMLSMPGGVGGLFNIFEVDPETMTYDYEQIEKDIATYGLFTYEELNAICPLSEDMFNAAGGAYLKISIGKGNLTMEELINMINRYSKFI